MTMSKDELKMRSDRDEITSNVKYNRSSCGHVSAKAQVYNESSFGKKRTFIWNRIYLMVTFVCLSAIFCN